MICDECETVVHCKKHGCIPKVNCKQLAFADNQLARDADETICKTRWNLPELQLRAAPSPSQK